jgi:hypothetical protein
MKAQEKNEGKGKGIIKEMNGPADNEKGKKNQDTDRKAGASAKSPSKKSK